MFDAAKEHRRINRMMRGLPIERARVKPAAPPPALQLPENWLAQRRLLRLDRAVTVFLLALTVLLLALAVNSVARAEEQPTAMYVAVSDGSWLNGRLKPDAGSGIEARFSAGDTVDVYEVSGSWAKVAGGECGYVWCDIRYLSETAPGTDTETRTVTANGRVRVRETPDGKLVRWLSDGDTVTVRCRIDGWAYIGDGYVLEKYLRTRESGPAPAGEPADEP